MTFRQPARIPRPPLNLCALTQTPHRTPVASPDGTIFEAPDILQLIRRTSLNPITGTPLHPHHLIPLNFSVDPRTASYNCPVLHTPFHPTEKVVAIATTGHVYSFTAVQRLNIHPGSLRDLIDGSPFATSDLIVLYDPALHVWSPPLINDLPDPHCRPVPLIPPVRHLLEKRALAVPERRRAPVKKPRRVELSDITAPLPNNSPLLSAQGQRVRTAEEQRKAIYKRIRKGRKGKGYVRVVTNIGHLNIELHCDKVPMTCDNFLTLAERKYYDGLLWHRVVPGFIAQTGDPTGKGDSGDSAWGGFLKDEIRTSLIHDAPGVVSMANSGRDTNRSQWFVCFESARHLDGAHTVFGKVVGGLFVLKKMENEAELGHPLTVERVEVLVNPIRQIREMGTAAGESTKESEVARSHSGDSILSQELPPAKTLLEQEGCLARRD